MSGVRYEACPVRSCPDHGRWAETAVCNDCGGCLERHCACGRDPDAIVGGGINLLRRLAPPGSGVVVLRVPDGGEPPGTRDRS